MPVLNYKLKVRRQGMPGVFYNLEATPAPMELQDTGVMTTKSVEINTPANPSAGIYATLNDALAAFQSEITGPFGSLAAFNGIFGGGYTFGAFIFYDQELKDILDLMPQTPVSTELSSGGVALNTAFQVSTSRRHTAVYQIDVSLTLSVLSGSRGTAILEIADNSAFTTNVKTIDSFTIGNSGILGLSTIQTITLQGHQLPAGCWCRITTQINTGSPSFTFRQGRRTLL